MLTVRGAYLAEISMSYYSTVILNFDGQFLYLVSNMCARQM